MSIDAMPYSQGWKRLALSPDVEFLKFNIANPDLSERGIPSVTGLLDEDVHAIRIEQISTVNRKGRIIIVDLFKCIGIYITSWNYGYFCGHFRL
jgi:hypothetical protein